MPLMACVKVPFVSRGCYIVLGVTGMPEMRVGDDYQAVIPSVCERELVEWPYEK